MVISRFRWILAALLVSTLAACGGGGGGEITPPPVEPPPAGRPSLDPTYRPSGHMAAGDVFVHLFEWRWTDIATECETVLGPAGFAAVQVSPPQEHSITPNHDWSERYQPVSYSIDRSRSGTRVEFIDMVSRCRAVGVGIYVDAVINHMTNFPSPGTGSNGTAYSKYSYPGLYTESDFHHPICGVSNYQDAANVQDCELLGLPDLNTGSSSVRQKIADYLIGLARLGVAGFRIDAAKHMQQVELDQILDLVNQTLASEGRPLPYWFLEVIGGSGEALRPQDYFGEGYSTGGAADITEFIFTGVQDKFLGNGGQRISQLNPNGPAGSQFSEAAWGLMPSDKAVVFLQNHDTQHAGGISYRDGQTFRLANVWMLAQPYGYPSILSAYAFNRPAQNDMGPPSDANGWTLPVSCAASLETAAVGQWVCEHRDPYIARMVGFRRRVAGTDVNHWWDDGANAIAFSRGNKGFVAINRNAAAVSTPVATGLPAGTYCDLLTGGRTGASCVGTSIIIDAAGSVQLNLAANTAIAIDAATKL
ncbi:MAG TPA: alpha-amylase family protein [Longimicrobium sp.]